MIIKLANADFSANNIGKINMPISNKTIELLSNYSRSFTDDDKYVIDAFLHKIGYITNSGVYSKMTTLILPVISDNITECRFNLVDKTGLTINTGYTDSTIQCTNGSLVATSSNSLIFRAAAKYTDLSIGYMGNYASDALSIHSGDTSKRIETFTSAAGYKGFSHYVSDVRKVICVSDGVPTVYRMNTTSVDVVSNSTEALNNVDDVAAYIATFGESSPNTIIMSSGSSIQYLCIAQYLTDNEAKTLNDAITALIAHFVN